MTFTEKSAISRTIVLVLLILLIGYYTVVHILVGKDVLFRVVINISPLILFIPGLLYRKYKAASLLCFVLLLFFIMEVQSLATQGNTLAESVAMTLICTLFVISMCYSRWQQRADVLENTKEQPKSSEGSLS